jgi:iron complex outermembrane receptor protein
MFNADYTPVIDQAYDASYAYARGPGTTVSAAYGLKF